MKTALENVYMVAKNDPEMKKAISNDITASIQAVKHCLKHNQGFIDPNSYYFQDSKTHKTDMFCTYIFKIFLEYEYQKHNLTKVYAFPSSAKAFTKDDDGTESTFPSKKSALQFMKNLKLMKKLQHSNVVKINHKANGVTYTYKVNVKYALNHKFTMYKVVKGF